MKKLLFITIISIFFACSKEENIIVSKPNLSGSWINITINKQFKDTSFFIHEFDLQNNKMIYKTGNGFKKQNFKEPKIINVFNYKIDTIISNYIYYYDSINKIYSTKDFYFIGNDSIYFYSFKSYPSARIN